MFIKTASSGSIAKAAAALGVSAPAVSKSIKTLEKQLGVRLLNRTTRKLASTEEGALYYERCRLPVLEHLAAKVFTPKRLKLMLSEARRLMTEGKPHLHPGLIDSLRAAAGESAGAKFQDLTGSDRIELR